jgi:hypothetical protein
MLPIIVMKGKQGNPNQGDTMRIEIITRVLYKYEELTEQAKEKAKNGFLENGGLDYPWWECIYEDAKTIGLTIESFDLDRVNLDGKLIVNPCLVSVKIRENHGKDCATYKLAVEFIEKFLDLEKQISAYEELLNHQETLGESEEKQLCEIEDKREQSEEEFTKKLKGCYVDMLRDYWNFLNSEEHITETLICNEWEFLEDGTRA